MVRIALIPSYEPDQHLLQLLQELCEAGFKRIVVDDGSGEAAQALYERVPEGTVVRRHPKNYGKGRALKTGLSYIHAQYPEDAVVVTLDADGQHRVADAVRCAQAAEESPGSLILGSRSFSEGVPLRSKFGNTVTRFIYRLSSGVSVGDTQTGLRAFHTEMIPFLLMIEGERYEYEMNMLLECPRRGVPIREIPTATVYENNNAGSHFQTFRDSYRIYRDILKFAGSSFIGFLVDYGLYSLLAVVTSPLGSIGVPLSNIAARVVSASVNYMINKRFVFHNHDSVLRTGVQYCLLAAGILCGNTLLLTWLVTGVGVNKFAAKLVTEVTFFTLSWLFQKMVVFRKKKTGDEVS